MTTRGAAGFKAMAALPRCGAWSRQAQRPCRQPVVRGKNRCHWHGGRNPGPPKGSQNGLIHGRYTREATAAKREVAAKAKAVRTFVAETIENADAAIATGTKLPPAAGNRVEAILAAAALAASKRKRRARTKSPIDGGSR